MKQLLILLIILFLPIFLEGQEESIHADSSLLEAIKQNDLQKVKSLLEGGANVNGSDSNDAPFLMWAVYKGDLPMVKYLVEKGADYYKKGIIMVSDHEWYGNLLVTATKEEKLDILKYLIEELSIPVDDKELIPENPVSASTETALVGAIINWWYKYDGFDYTREAILNYLITKDTARIEKYKYRRILEFYKRIDTHVASKKSLNTKDSLLLRAIQRNDLSEIKRLVEDEANFNGTDTRGTPFLMWAAFKGDLLTVKYLIDQGANFNKEGFIPSTIGFNGIYYVNLVGIAAGENKLDMIKYLVEDLNIPSNETYFNYPSNMSYSTIDIILWGRKFQPSNYIEIVDYLISSGVEPNISWTEMGRFYVMTGQYRKYLSNNLKNLQRVESNKEARLYNRSYAWLGVANAYRDLGQPEKALPYMKKSLELWQQYLDEDYKGDNLPRNYAYALIRMSGIYRNLDKYAEALSYALESLEIMENLVENYPKNEGYRFFYQEVKVATAFLLIKSGKAEQCLTLLDSLNENVTHFYGTTVTHIYHHLKQYEKALLHLEKTLTFYESFYEKDFPKFGPIYNSLAGLYELRGLNPKASKFYELSINHAINRISKTFDAFSEEEQTGLWGKIQKQFSDQQSFALRHPENELMLGYAYNGQLLTKGLLLGNRKKLLEGIRQTNDYALKEKYREWEGLRKSLARQYGLPEGQRHTEFETFEIRVNELESELAEISASFREAHKTIDWKEVQRQLAPNEAAIEFAHYQYFANPHYSDSTYYCAYVVRPGDEHPKMAVLFEEKQLIDLLGTTNVRRVDYIDHLYGFDKRGIVPEGERANLSELIWKPLEPLLEGVERIFYAPSGLLHRINLPAIPISNEESLEDRFEWNCLGSTRQLVFDQNASSETYESTALIYSGIHYDMDSIALTAANAKYDMAMNTASPKLNPDYQTSSTRGGDWRYLKASEVEGTKIQIIIEKAGAIINKRTGYEATEESFKMIGTKSPSPRILHLATHGYFFPDPKLRHEVAASESNRLPFELSEHPMVRSGLILAGANKVWKGEDPLQGFDDGILTAYEISQMNLSNTELVVLSACETGLGDIEGNEGVYGLQRAFKIAGVKYLIMSLWQVPDYQTQELMTTFYSKWLESEMKIPNAFRAAQKEMRERYYQNPYFWAGFVLVE